mgnify:CR=1 FL=1
MLIYLRFLAVSYFVGFVLHTMDVLDLRLQFSQMSLIWQIWIVYLMIFDFLASVGLWLARAWGVFIFVTIATSQLVAYIFFQNIFGSQMPLVFFHFASLGMFFLILVQRKLRRS